MKKQFAAYLAVAAIGEIALITLYRPHDAVGMSILTALIFVIPIFITEVGSLWYFLSSLKTFQRGLKIAYYLLSFGIFLFGLAQMQLPIGLLLNVLGIDPNLIQLVLLATYAFGTLIMYAGARKFARLLQVKSLWNSFWFAIAFSLGVAFVSALIPHPPIADLPEPQHDILFGLVAWSGAYSVAAAVATWRTSRVIGQAYQKAIVWMATAHAMLALAYWQLVLAQTLGTYSDAFFNWYTNTNIALLPYLLASVLFLRAGQLIKIVGRQYGTLPDKADALDVVMYTARLASDPRAIEPVLNQIRQLTAAKQPGAQLTPDQITQLKAIYLKLEDHLLTGERLRKFVRADIRVRLPHDFQQTLPPPPATPVTLAPAATSAPS